MVVSVSLWGQRSNSRIPTIGHPGKDLLMWDMGIESRVAFKFNLFCSHMDCSCSHGTFLLLWWYKKTILCINSNVWVLTLIVLIFPSSVFDLSCPVVLLIWNGLVSLTHVTCLFPSQDWFVCKSWSKLHPGTASKSRFASCRQEVKTLDLCWKKWRKGRSFMSSLTALIKHPPMFWSRWVTSGGIFHLSLSLRAFGLSAELQAKCARLVTFSGGFELIVPRVNSKRCPFSHTVKILSMGMMTEYYHFFFTTLVRNIGEQHLFSLI